MTAGRGSSGAIHAPYARWLQRYAFRATSRPRIGAEVEFILHDDQGRVASVATQTLPVLTGHAFGAGWQEVHSAKGAPRFTTPSGGCVTLEPGGQLEYATAPHDTVAALWDELQSELAPLLAHFEEVGIRALGAGIDPVNGIETTPLQLDAPRYRAMDAYFARIGPAGARMMRQTAAIQINVDSVEPYVTWDVLNAAVPAFVAMFANSPIYAGAPTGAASMRSLNWRSVDPARTGIVNGGDPAAAYARFALAAPVMLDPTGRHAPFGEMVAPHRADAWRTHLTTLFPEVRPKGYLELRAIDALPLPDVAAAVAVVAGLVMDATSLTEARRSLEPATPELLELAARSGVYDARVAQLVKTVCTLAFDGCDRLGPDYFGEARERADDFRARYVAKGRMPADDAMPPADADGMKWAG